MGQIAAVGMGDWLSRLNDAIQNAWYGVVSPAQKAAAIEEEAQAIVKASAGRISIEEARRIATGDVTKVLTVKNADPSQAGFTNIALFDSPNLKWWLLGGVGVVAAILLLKD